MLPEANHSMAELYARQFQQGNEQALRYFFNEYYPTLCIYGQKLCGHEGFAAEMASEAFHQTWRQRAQLGTAASIRAYLFTLVKNGCAQYLRKKARQLLSKYVLSQPPEKNAQEAIIYTETIHELRQSINRLPRQCSAVLRLLFVEGRTIAEVASELNLSISTVKTHKRIGLAALRKEWKAWQEGVRGTKN